jgi:hypothetical protein
VLTSLIVSFGAVGLAAVALMAAVLAVIVLSCGAMWPWMNRDICMTTIHDAEQRIKVSPASPHVARALKTTERLHQACANETIGWGSAMTVEQIVERGMTDGSWDEPDQRRLEQQAATWLKPVAAP